MKVSELKHYNDLRKFVSPPAFTSALSYISWHNRLTMTDMLEVWEALVVAYTFAEKPIEPFLYPRVKEFLAQTRGRMPLETDDCKIRATELLTDIFSPR